MDPRKSQLPPLTGVRFFLAMWVVLFHQTAPDALLDSYLPLMPELVASVLRAGYAAVDLFFVLSGFVLAYNYSLEVSWRRAQVVQFAIARFARIYPAYVFGLILVAPRVVHDMAGDVTIIRIAKEVGIAAMNWTLLQAWIPGIALTWNGPGWSLSNEAFFYLCFPFVGVALWRISGRRNIVLAIVGISLLSAIFPWAARSIPLEGFGEAVSTVPPETYYFWVYLQKFHPLMNLPDFCIGILLGRAYEAWKTKPHGLLGKGYWLYLPGAALELAVISHSTEFPHLFETVRLPMHALVILGLALGGGPLADALGRRTMIYLGNASYALYIVHIPLFIWMNVVAARLFQTQLSGAAGLLLYLVLLTALAAAVLTFLEEPANRFLKRRLAVWFECRGVRAEREKTSPSQQ